MKKPEISIILPCRNEEQALDFCLKQIKQVIKTKKINAEIIVSDSSTDNSPKIAKKHKVNIIKHNKEGYGNAYIEAFPHAKANYIFMADCDGTYDFNEIPKFIEELKQGADFIIGNRFSGNIEPGAMSFSHKFIGNPILSFILRLFFFTKIKDTQSGMRAITKQALNNLNLKTTGMELASEMIIKAIRNKLKIKELPISYYKRKGISKLKPFSDAWKHLRFMLLYSPLFLFFIPGIILFLIGLISMILLYLSKINLFGIQLFYHPMFISALLIIIGYQLIFFAFFAKSYSLNHLGENESNLMKKLYKLVTIEKASIFGILTAVIGLIIYTIIFINWLKSGFGALNEIKNSIVALTFITLGIQTIFYSFMLSILGIKER